MLLAVAALEWLLKNWHYTKFNKAITWMFSTTMSQVARKSKIDTIVMPKRIELSSSSRKTQNHNIFLGTFFKEKWNYKLFLLNRLNELQIWMISNFYLFVL